MQRITLSQRDLQVLVAALVFGGALLILTLANPLAQGSLTNTQAILLRYVEQMRAGNGMVFNTNEPILLVGAPFYLLSLTLVSLWPGLTVITATYVLFALSLALGSVSVFRIVRRLEPEWVNVPNLKRRMVRAASVSTQNVSEVAVITGLGYASVWMLWAGLGTAYPLAAGLAALSLNFALEQRWRGSGIALGLAVLCAPEALILALPLFIIATHQNGGTQWAFPLLFVLIVAYSGLMLYYGGAFWHGLLLFREPTSLPLIAAINRNPLLWILLIALGVWGWRVGVRRTVLQLSGAMIVGFVTVALVILGLDESALYGLIAAPVILLLVAGMTALPLQIPAKPILSAGVIVVLMTVLSAATINPQPSPAVNASESVSAPAQTTVGVTNLRELDLRQLPLETAIIAYDGTLQPEVREMVERGNLNGLLIRTAPDVLTLRSGGWLNPSALQSASLQPLGYAIDPTRPGRFRRTAALGDFQPLPLTTTGQYGPHITLTAAAVAQPQGRSEGITAGAWRVRLDWQVARSASKPVTVQVRLKQGERVVAEATDTLEVNIFRAGTTFTYHAMTVERNAGSGTLKLEVAVIVSEGVVNRLPIAEIALRAG